MTEYYFAPNLNDYDAAFKAVAFFSFKYGKIDWLEQDAKLRTDFHITTGEQFENIGRIKNKSAMKAYYAKAGVPTARLDKVTTIEATKNFIAQVGYPVIVKPDVGVGASDTFKPENDAHLANFFHTLPPSIMGIVLKHLDLSYYTAAHAPEKLCEVGRATAKAFEIKSRFVHPEFFRLTEATTGLEVNMRPAGGYTPDMIDFAHSTDVYQIRADMVTSNERKLPDDGEHFYCVYASRRDRHSYIHTHEEVLTHYGKNLVMCA